MTVAILISLYSQDASIPITIIHNRQINFTKPFYDGVFYPETALGISISYSILKKNLGI